MFDYHNASCNTVEDIQDEADKALSKEEIAALRSVMYKCWNRPPHNRRFPNGAAIDLILNTGLRMGEALALKWSDISFEKNV